MKSNENFYKRLSELSGIKQENTSKSRVNESAELVEFFRSKDKTAYGVIREGHNYYIKKSTKLSEDLSAPDFSHINGIANKADYKYDTLNRAQKNAKLFVESINEAFDLGATKKPQRKSAPSLNVGNDINSFISNRLAESKEDLKYKKQERFKSSLKEQKENINKIKKGQLPESADLAIKRALGLINEEDLITKDSEIQDSDSVNKDGQSKEDAQAPVTDKNAKSQADTKNAKGGKFDKAEQPKSLGVNEEDLSTADSEIKDADDVNKDGQSKETPEAPVNDTNAKSKADSRDAKSGNTMDKKVSQPKSLSVDESEEALSTIDSEINTDDLSYPDKQFGDSKIKDADELDNVILADSEIDSDGSMANQDNATKESSQSPVNDTNAKSLADKAVAEGRAKQSNINEGKFYDHVLQGDEATEENAYDHARGFDWQSVETTEQDLPNLKYVDTVDGVGIYYDYAGDYYVFKDESGDINESKEGEPFKEKTKGGGKSTEDSDQTDGDRVDNKSKKEKVDSYDSHNKPEMAHKEKKGTPLKDKVSKKDVVAEGQEYDEVMKKFNDGELKDAHGNIVTDAGRAEAIANAKGNPSEVEEADGEDDIEAAADALNDLENADMGDDESQEPEMEEPSEEQPEMDAEPEAEEGSGEEAPEAPSEKEPEGEEDIDIDIDGLDLDGNAEEGGEETEMEEPSEEEPEGKEGGGETEMDSESDSDELMKKEIEKMIGKLTYKVRNIDLEPTQAKSFMNSLIDAFKKDIADIEVIDRKEMADEILKVDDQPEEGDKENVDVDVDADQVDIDADSEAEEVEENMEIYEDEMGGNRMTFEQYAESRGYTSEELHECGSEEKANLMSGYIDEMDNNLEECDCEEMGSYADDDVMNELSEYGHDEHVEKLRPFQKPVKEGRVTHGMHEPMVDPSLEEDDADMDELEVEDEVEAEAGFAPAAQNLGVAGSKSKSVSIDLNSNKIDYNVSEAEEKVRKYTQKRLKQLSEGKKITMNESKKSEKMKKIDRIIESEYLKMSKKLSENKK